jgi:uncharacterized RDD family membrane protein YckC
VSRPLADADAGGDAGAVSRLAAYLTDTVVIAGSFSAGAAATAFVTRVVTGYAFELGGDRDVAGVALVAWWFGYFAVGWATTGTTPGMALFGVRVVGLDGSPATGRQAVVRTLAFPLSVLPLGLGFLGVVLHRRRRALHDLAAGTVVVYADSPGPRPRPRRDPAMSAQRTPPDVSRPPPSDP